MLDLAGGGARHLVVGDERHVARALETCEALAAPLAKLGFARRPVDALGLLSPYITANETTSSDVREVRSV